VSAVRSWNRRWSPGGVWRSSAYVRIWAASVISGLGSSITALALPLLAALTLNATPFQMGLLIASETVPILLFGLATGVWVDRRPKRPVMIAADIGRAALLLLVPVAAWLGVLRIELLLVIAFLVGTLSVFFEIASQSYLPVILSTEDLTEGNARLHTGWGIAEVGGPGLAGWLTQLFSAPIAILVDGVSYIVSAALMAGIRAPEPASHPALEGSEPNFWRELREGLRVVLGNSILRATAAATGLWNIFSGARTAVLVLFLTRTAGLQAGAVGVMFTLGAVGYLFGSLLPERMARRLGLGRAILLGIVLAVPSELLTAFASGPPSMAAVIAGTGFFLTGLTIPTYDVNQFSLRQAVTPLRLQGRVSATMRTLIRGLLPLGALAGGLLAERIGLREVMIVSAFGGPAAFLAIWFSPVRSLQTPPARMVEGEG
jgi:predicted MFS family arabinose efflux permease